MSQNETASQTGTPDSGWKTLAEFSLPSVEGNDRQAARLVAEAVNRLSIPLDRMERLKTAVSEATMNATEHGNRFAPDLPVSIKVMVSGQGMAVQITDYGQSGPIDRSERPDIEAKLNGAQTTRGWGFFLIEKMVDEVKIKEDNAHHTIYLYLYLEGSGDTRGADCEPEENEE